MIKANQLRGVGGIILAVGLCWLVAGTPVMGADNHQTQQQQHQFSVNSDNPCGTQIMFERKVAANPDKYAASAKSPDACPNYGMCDVPANRDQWIPDSTTPFTEIRMIIHLLTNDDGSGAISSESYAMQQVSNLNNDYAQAHIRFVATVDFVHSSQWRTLSENEIDNMKSASAVKPDSMLNIWVTTVDFGYSFGTFPWDPDALTPLGGVVLGHFHWLGGLNSVFAHEVGHCLGLWHIFNGVSEVDQCGSCYEYVGAPDADVLGDRCLDTPPGPVSYNCGNAGGTDPCSGQPWGYTMPENYMSYAPQSCYSYFTPDQRGRMHCWINDHLTGWISGVRFDAQPTFGPAPLQVDFNAVTNKTVTNWNWTFGDGGTASVEDPAHTYTQPGYYNVKVTIQSTEGEYADLKSGLVAVYGDTLRMDSVDYAPGIIRVDVNADNFIPVSEMIIPFTWDGSFDMRLDSLSTAGLRTDYFATKTFLNVDNNTFHRAVIKLSTAATGTQDPLAPGTGPVLSLFFEATGAQSGDNPVQFISYNNWSPLFTAPQGSYAPTTFDGVVSAGSASCCVGTVGNVDCSADDQVTLSDLSAMIDHLFVSLGPLCCEEEANVDLQPGITLGDLSVLIDHLFVSLDPLPSCP